MERPTAHLPGSGPVPETSARLEPEAGSSWGRFRIERLLGEGGMGRVFLADDPTLDRRIALKVLRGHLPGLEARFTAEARAQAKVEHEHICRVYEVGEVSGAPYIAMQYVAGGSLRELPAALSTEAKARLIEKVARAVEAAHRVGLIHRDLKPANILVERRESGELHPYVTDFGIARTLEAPGLTRSGHVMGSVEYLPPEVVGGEDSALGPGFDVWGLGVTLYELLSGHTPFAADTELKVLSRLVREEPEPIERLCPDLSPGLSTIVMKCLERDPAQRYQTVEALATDLGRFLRGEPVPARRLRRARRFFPLVAALLATLLVGGVGILLWQPQPDVVVDAPHGVLASDLEGEPPEVVELFEKGLAARRQGKSRESILLLKAAASRSQRSALPLVFAGLGELATGQGEEASASFGAARAKLETSPQPFALLLLRYVESQREPNADRQAAATALLAMRPGAYHARLALAHLHLDRGGRASALAHLQKIEPAPGLGRAAALVAADRGSLGDVAGARAFLAQLDLAEAARSYALGRLAYTDKNLREAIAHLDQGAKAAVREDLPELAAANEEFAAIVAIEAEAADAFSRLKVAAQKAFERSDLDGGAELFALAAYVAHREGDLARRDEVWALAQAAELSPWRRAALAVTGPLIGLPFPGLPAELAQTIRAESPTETAGPKLLEAAAALSAGQLAEARLRLAEAEREGLLSSWAFREYFFAYQTILGLPTQPCRVDPPFPNRLRFVACWVAGGNGKP